VTHIDFDLGGPIFPSGTIAAADLGDLAYDEGDPAGNRDRIRDTIATILIRGAVPLVMIRCRYRCFKPLPDADP